MYTRSWKLSLAGIAVLILLFAIWLPISEARLHVAQRNTSVPKIITEIEAND